MAYFPSGLLSFPEREELERRRRFLQALVEQAPSLGEEDREAFSGEARELGLADTRMQLAELLLVLDATPAAREQLAYVADDTRLRELAPLRALTAAVTISSAPADELWSAARAAARSEGQVELFSALRLATAGTTQADGAAQERRDSYAEAAPMARIRQIEPLVAPERASSRSAAEDPNGRLVAEAAFVALHADYAARLQASREARERMPSLAPWSLIDWPLLMAHLALQRAGRSMRRGLFSVLSLPNTKPDPPPFDLMLFLEEVAQELAG